MRELNIIKSLISTSALFASSLGLATSQTKPNVIFFLVDDMGFMDVGFNGQKYFQTPNIDKMAADGMIFTNGYANASNSAPTRACLISGKYCPRHGIYTVNNSDRGAIADRRLIPTPNTEILNTNFYTVAEMFKATGYITGSFGKWHLGAGASTGPQGQGFDVNVAGSESGSPNSYFSPYNLPELTNGPTGEYLTDRITDEAINFITTNKDKPFFAYIPHYAVHTPVQGKDDLKAKYESLLPQNLSPRSPAFAAMVESVDQSFGRILNQLKTLGIEDNTIIVFFSDNGGHSSYSSMKPLTGHKGMLYEGGIREPMAIKWPAKIQAGTKCDVPVIGTDFFPTFKEIIGGIVPQGHVFDGVSILPLLTQQGQIADRAIFWHAPHYLEKYSNDLFKFRCTPSTAMRKGDWKMIQYFEIGNIELFNLKNDISETNDLAEFMPEKVQEMLQEMNQWRSSVNAPVPSTPNSGFVDILTYTNIPTENSIVSTNGNTVKSLSISGICKSAAVEKVILKIYSNSTVFKKDSVLISAANQPFNFNVSFPASDHSYKIKVYFVRNVVEEVDKIVNNVSIISNINGVGTPSTSKFSIYPNPGNGLFHIKSNETVEKLKIYIYSASGMEIQTSNNQNKIDLSNQEDGIYLVKLKSDQQTIGTQTLIKKK